MGKHAKPSSLKRKTLISIGVAAGATMPLALVTAPTAEAATVSAWDKIAQCEAGGDWSINHSSDGLSVGGLQFQNPSWQDALAYLRAKGYNTSTWPQRLYQGMPRSSVPTKYQQIIAGEALLALQGPSAWVCNAMVGYPLKGAYQGTNSSMFKGGANPYPGGTPTPAPTPTPTPTPTPAPSNGTVTVQSGDTLYLIAQKYMGDGEKWRELYELNKSVIGSNPDAIEVGMVLKLPVKATHTVVSGDTLYAIAVKYGFGTGSDNWKPIYEANKTVIGSDPDLITPGMVLAIPYPAPTTTSTTTSSAAPAPTAPAPSTTAYVKPVNAKLSQSYGVYRSSYTLGYHTGADFSAASGTPVFAVTKGTVVASDSASSYGNNVQIKNDDGKYLLYAHLSSKSVSVGQRVVAGQKVGAVGSTGNSTGPHLHLEVRTAPKFKAGNFINPVGYFRSHGVTL